MSVRAQQLQQQMAEARQRLREDVRGIKENVGELTDWRHHVKRHPWVSFTAAAALGLLAVPKRLQTMHPDTLAKLAKDRRLVVQSQAEARVQNRGVIGSLAGFAGNFVLRAALAHAVERLGTLFAQSDGESAASDKRSGVVVAPPELRHPR